MEMCGLCSSGVIVLRRENHSRHRTVCDANQLTAGVVLVKEVYRRVFFSASGIKFFNDSEENMSGERAQESHRGGCDL